MNKVILQGNLGGDPELRATPGKVPVCTFSVATNETVPNKAGEPTQLTEWHLIATFGTLAENCAKYLKKGEPALIEGKIRSSKWTDKEGIERLSFKIVADTVRFLSGRSAESEAAPRTLEYSPEEHAL